jgi:hypothetical protein
MAPLFTPGMILIAAPDHPIAAGDAAYVHLTSGEHLVATVAEARGGGWMLAFTSGTKPPRFVAADDVEGMDRIVWVKLPGSSSR